MTLYGQIVFILPFDFGVIEFVVWILVIIDNFCIDDVCPYEWVWQLSGDIWMNKTAKTATETVVHNIYMSRCDYLEALHECYNVLYDMKQKLKSFFMFSCGHQ